jgi:hypothetical protein
LARNRTHYISKGTFLPAFKTAFELAFSKSNIQAGFRGAGLVPHDPEAVLSKLDVVVQTPVRYEEANGDTSIRVRSSVLLPVCQRKNLTIAKPG